MVVTGHKSYALITSSGHLLFVTFDLSFAGIFSSTMDGEVANFLIEARENNEFLALLYMRRLTANNMTLISWQCSARLG